MNFLDELREQLEAERRLTPDSVCRLISSRWGGEQVYIGKEKKRDLIEKTDKPKILINRGIPRSTAYNWVNRWRKMS